jgi:hypothetical protein
MTMHRPNETLTSHFVPSRSPGNSLSGYFKESQDALRPFTGMSY